MNPYDLTIVVLLLAALTYQEWSRRDRERTADEWWKTRLAQDQTARADMENRYEARLAEAVQARADLEKEHEARVREVADREFERGLAAGGGQVESYEFTRQAEKKVFFFKSAQELSLMLVLYRGKVIRAHGDVSNVELFELPEEIKRAIAAARRAGEVFEAVPKLPRLAA